MAIISTVERIVIIALITCSSLRHHETSVTAQESSLQTNYEALVRKELETLVEADLSTEIKLTRVVDEEQGISFFYHYAIEASKKRSLLFSWKSSNASSSENVLVIGSTQGRADKNLIEWMCGTFIALRRANNVPTPPYRNTTHYYAQIAYVRNEATGYVVEWDRWSPRTAKNLIKKMNEAQATATFSFDTFLCAYGTCACEACQCDAPRKNEEQPKTQETVLDEDLHLGESVDSALGEVIGKDNKKPSPILLAEPSSKPQPKRVAQAEKPKKRKRSKGLASANANAHSKKGNAYTYAIAKGRGRSQSSAIADDGTAIAEAGTLQDGETNAYSKGHVIAISDARSKSGDSKAVAITDDGVAQASSQSRGGTFEAKAVRNGEDGMEYHEDDDDVYLDPESIVSDTNRAFAQAADNIQMAKSHLKAKPEDVCSREYEIDTDIVRDEWKELSQNGSIKNYVENNSEPIGGGKTYRYKNPLRFGIDFELGLNSSIRVTNTYPGFVVYRESCCGLVVNSSAVAEFLSFFKQDCNAELEMHAGRLGKGNPKSEIKKLMKTKRLSVKNLKDLVPLVLIYMHTERSTLSALPVLKKVMKESTSDLINRVVAIIVNSMNFAVKEGQLHKVKLLKGLALNVRTVWTGIMFEYKKCVVEMSCSEKYFNQLKNEKRLILGLYLFLRFADARFTAFPGKDKPLEVFIDFVRLHSVSIAKLAYCKSRRVGMNFDA